MSNQWNSEFEISTNLAQALIEEQFPSLSPAKVEYIASGWDNAVFRVNHVYMFRFPRRKVAVPLIETENHVLPKVALSLEGEVPISTPIFLGKQSEQFPYPFSGYHAIEGRTAAEQNVTKEQRIDIAKPMASFLKKLHAIPNSRLQDWGVGQDTIARLDLQTRGPKLEKELTMLEKNGMIKDAAPYLQMIDEARAAQETQQTFVHGDLYFRNFLVGEHGGLAGIIDWGDLHIGNPAVDLAIAFSFFPLEGRKIFFENYGAVDEDTLYLARFRALYVMSYLVFYGMDIEDQQITDEALVSMEHILENE
ncbi:phosphotransferase [Cytobacillus purgationiresistens]|uniref:Aminoglycoside phosphotransferase (APT) family kinase protein n=1 Tax=Cytobacillus purgationiresistens TaxID=863449 RepID=A0ABU0AQ89_9BACI|nr:phosphotransferase [Cytobacillus purgationiresistens]MDQ0273444.1 aminoglycoside phosphotransferase (APT) family kinase protein [Cytobacillus purgationiresistens]